jgi:hypothetical protein
MADNESSRRPDRALAGFFGPVDDTQLGRRKEDLLRRAGLVTMAGWDKFCYQWSTGEVLGTALVLQDGDQILRWGETAASVLARWAFDLWGIGGGQTDVDAGCATTLAWFDSIRSELTSERSIPARTEKGWL